MTAIHRRLAGRLTTASPGRIDHWRARYQELRGRQRYKLLIDITNGCNLRCTFCPRQTGALTTMSTRDFQRAIDNTLGRIDDLQLSCAWEYSVAKNAAEIVASVGEKRISRTAIYTNGNILGDDLARTLVEAGIGAVLFSIGEARLETYEKMRKGGKFHRVLANIEKLVALKKRLGSALPVVGANLTVTRTNIEEMPDFVDLAERLGIEEIRGRHLILNQGAAWVDDKIADQARADAVIAAARRKAEGLGIRFSVPLFSEIPERKGCRAPWHQLYVAADGEVSVCPRLSEHAPVGNLFRETLPQILAGSRVARLRREFMAGRFTNPVCGICEENQETEVAIDQGY